ncbi:aspartic proteinase 36 isoform X3 [Medicago truncatula]|uniref:aspartic proteinase 36 isoform X3 n=1 Tax=Medicago truncatula TaxID=3880 RepID=UPI000D2F47FB|nr:aspartic proteinase 36 isoform X3 [Medicago truncatula]
MMDLRYLLLIILALEILCVANGDNLVFQVERRKTTLSGIKHHDHHRRGRFLSSVDFNLGGNGLPTRTGLYFTKLGLGSPKKDYYVQVDTGSDILWVNCVECSRCPTKSQIGMDLTLYDPKGSHTSELISCDHEFCSSTYDGPIPGCKAETPCPYSITYGDGSATTGYYVRDYLTFDRINGNLHTAPQNSSIIFGAHYNVVLKNIEVDGDVLQLPSDIFDSGNGKGTVIDSGTTLAYLPVIVYDQLIPKIFARQPELKLARIEEQFKCFPYAGNVDGGFPVVKLHFEGSLSLTVYPHDYLFQYKVAGVRCIGWQKSVTQTKDGKDMTLLGDLVLSNKLVLYDLENMAIGWTEYNCSSSIKVKDATTGIVHTVGAHNISSASTFLIGRILSFFLLLIAMLNCFYN